jgi:peptide/nickel transport system substrate-binding protein
LVPPLITESVGRDVSDLIYERLADLAPGRSPIDTSAYRPRLAVAWQRLDSLTWRFRLRPGARWQDGEPVTAEDVEFSFAAFADSTLDAPARPYLAHRVAVIIEDSATVRVRFSEPSPEQLYDATYHVRIMPKHIWQTLPTGAWQADTALARLVGTGPYRVRRWERGRYLILEADPHAWRRPHISRVVWRFTSDPDATLNLVLSGEADVLETIGPPQRAKRFEGDSTYELRPYPGSMYGFLAFHVADSSSRAHPLFGDRTLRRGLSFAVDRPALARALFGPKSPAPSGPMSQLLWINGEDVALLPYDTAAAARALDAAGWRRASASGVRERRGTPLRFDILVPSSSSVRRQAAIMLQEAWRRAGASVSVTTVDFPVFEERIRHGRFDTYIGAYLDEPSARGLADQWSRAGWGNLNFGRYANPVFDSLFGHAGRTTDLAVARRLYREALDTLNADAPAIFLYAPTSIAAIRRTLAGVELDPYSWLSGLPDWRLEPNGPPRLASAP